MLAGRSQGPSAELLGSLPQRVSWAPEPATSHCQQRGSRRGESIPPGGSFHFPLTPQWAEGEDRQQKEKETSQKVTGSEA